MKIQKIDKVEALSDNKYKVNYNDMGNKGACIITVVSEGENILFDKIDRK